MSIDLQREVDNNYDFFCRSISKYREDNIGKYALIRQAKVVSFHESFISAESNGEEQFPDGLFSIQPVTPPETMLGFMGYVAAVGHSH